MKHQTNPKEGAPDTTQPPRPHPDRLRRPPPVSNAGLILPSTLALHLWACPNWLIRLALGRAPGGANTGDKIMTLVASALAGGDMPMPTWQPRGCWAAWCHPPWGHSCGASVGAMPAGSGEPGVAGPGLGRWGRTRRRAVDHRLGLHHETYGLAKEGARHHGYTGQRGYRCWPSPPAPATC